MLIKNIILERIDWSDSLRLLWDLSLFPQNHLAQDYSYWQNYEYNRFDNISWWWSYLSPYFSSPWVVYNFSWKIFVKPSEYNLLADEIAKFKKWIRMYAINDKNNWFFKLRFKNEVWKNVYCIVKPTKTLQIKEDVLNLIDYSIELTSPADYQIEELENTINWLTWNYGFETYNPWQSYNYPDINWDYWESFNNYSNVITITTSSDYKETPIKITIPWISSNIYIKNLTTWTVASFIWTFSNFSYSSWEWDNTNNIFDLKIYDSNWDQTKTFGFTDLISLIPWENKIVVLSSTPNQPITLKYSNTYAN